MKKGPALKINIPLPITILSMLFWPKYGRLMLLFPLYCRRKCETSYICPNMFVIFHFPEQAAKDLRWALNHCMSDVKWFVAMRLGVFFYVRPSFSSSGNIPKKNSPTFAVFRSSCDAQSGLFLLNMDHSFQSPFGPDPRTTLTYSEEGQVGIFAWKLSQRYPKDERDA